MNYVTYKRADILKQAEERARQNQSDKPPKYTHAGHRERVRESFRQTDGVGMRESQLLEMLLFYSLPRRDTLPVALRLLEKFGSINAVFSAPAKQLMEVRGISRSSAALLRLTGQFLDTMAEEKLRPVPQLTTAAEQSAYCRRVLRPGERQLCSLCLDAMQRPLCVKAWALSELTESPIQTVLGDVGLNHANQLVVALYQPDDPFLPSDEELMLMMRLPLSLAPLRVTFLDALFLTDTQCMSARRMRLLL